MINKDKIYELLKQKIDETCILQNEPMSKHTTFKTGGNASFFVIAKSEDDIKNVLQISNQYKIPLYIIGNGSNILVKDTGFDGIILKIDLCNIEFINKEEYVEITVGAGYKLGKLSGELFKKGISGFEFASGIPGTMGGAIRMNAGAYGKEMQEIVISTKAMDLKGNTYIIKNDKHEFSYRHSIFIENKNIILETKIKLEYGNKDEIKQKIDEYSKQRKEKQPLEYPSAGSTFKRGESFITAKLIDECGLKGYTIGGAQVSEKHAGFIINKENATSEDILELIEYVKKIVFEKTNNKIELEIEVVG